MSTLHGYILRDLLRTFLLTVAALTGVFTLCGGLLNIARREALNAGDLFAVLPLLLPVAVTFTMPVAALFAATLVYGRLAADNELTACRAAGINVHRLLLSAVLLALFTATATALLSNFVIPDFMRRLDRFVRANAHSLAYNRLRNSGYMRHTDEDGRSFMLTAQRVELVAAEALTQRGFEAPEPNLGYFWVEQPTLLWLTRDSDLQNFAIADGALCEFDTRDSQLSVAIYVSNAISHEVGRGSVQVAQQKFEVPVNIPFPLKAGMADLPTLLRWRRAAWEIPELQRRIERVRNDYVLQRFYDELGRVIAAGKTIVFESLSGRSVELTARELQTREDRPLLTDVVVAIAEPQTGPTLRLEAPLARITGRSANRELSTVELRLLAADGRPILEQNPRLRLPPRPIEQPTYTVADLQVPPAVRAALGELPAQRMLDASFVRTAAPNLTESFQDLQSRKGLELRRIDSELHFRFGYAASTLVTILGGAALGILFRGSQALTAFGLACVPFGAAIILMLMGRQLAQGESTFALGPPITWGGLGVLTIINTCIVAFGVRR